MGFGEILFILIVAVMLWGPGKMVDVAKTLGRMIYNLKKTTSDFTNNITREIELEQKGHLPPPKTSTENPNNNPPPVNAPESTGKGNTTKGAV